MAKQKKAVKRVKKGLNPDNFADYGDYMKAKRERENK